eukprot:CAMPEP_0116932250 /NCGR_PEP_ID=MMETSP0467-20121206/28318_1 /TAXON_ID=283647 /ORGANISM="Mesodinium pulex, Strain SPMC105" /LENGTH=99 /DNA_ID=CAMNT_0004612881 /DNA_START=210 /DNA_END=509 /DNA_ORIENTATION=+
MKDLPDHSPLCGFSIKKLPSTGSDAFREALKWRNPIPLDHYSDHCDQAQAQAHADGSLKEIHSPQWDVKWTDGDGDQEEDDDGDNLYKQFSQTMDYNSN